ncbi:MAG: hypothetical protein LBI57_03270 [Helicobacteraceae bacterium]|nr:hypothetical protein [Helicobacteraceae bacterium]
MKKIYLLFPLIIALSSCMSSRLYKPMNDVENMNYININKNILPEDVRKNTETYSDEFIGWVGIVENYNIENNIIQFTLKHRYYDWIEDFGYLKGPILLSSNGEGYIVGDYILRLDLTEDQINEFIQDFIGDCLIVYGYPNKVMENGEIFVETKYVRRISKKYVDPNWRKYGRNGLE